MLLTGPRFHLTTTSGSGVTFVEETFVEEIFADFIFVIYDLIQKNLFPKNIENDTSYKNLYDFKKKNSWKLDTVHKNWFSKTVLSGYRIAKISSTKITFANNFFH